MMSLAEEIQLVAENADKCVNYPIGDKLEQFMRLQDDANESNFVVSGVVIYASTCIYGRKVDYLEQEIIGVSKNFEAVAVATSDEKHPEKEMKKSRSKKFFIKDRVNIEKQSFEEKPIQVLTKIDINKTISAPSKIDRLQRMKDFFSKNKSRGGKLVIPKSLLFTNDNVVSNFGSTPIYELDDNKEILGSRRDFTSFSYFINGCTGELQAEILTNKNQIDCDISNCQDIPELAESPDLWKTPPTSPLRLVSTSRPPTPAIQDSTDDFQDANDYFEEMTENNISPLSINVDEGIEIDDATKATMLLSPLTVKLMDVVRKSPNVFSDAPKINDTVDIDEFGISVVSTQHDQTNDITDFDLPLQMIRNEESKMKNIFMIPLKKLKHKCAFDLPNDEYGEIKKRKRDQFKPVAADSVRQARAFKQLQMPSTEDEGFLGFTKEEQQAAMTVISYDKPIRLAVDQLKTADMTRKFSNDSGWQSGTDLGDITEPDSDLLKPNESFKTNEASSRQLADFSSEPLESSVEQLDSTVNDEPNNSKINTSGGDSCYHSCVSGESSSKTELSSFFRDIEERNETIDQRDEDEESQPDELSEENVREMQQLTVTIAEWTARIKPRLADSEARNKINVKEYGVEIIRKIGNVDDEKTLADITEPGRTPAFFLSMLHLINTQNVEITHGERTMDEPVDIKNIKIKLKSTIMHQDEMDQHFEQEKKVQKRKAMQTSTPAKHAKRVSLGLGESSLSFNSSDASQNVIECTQPSQSSSGYFSQNSTMSDC